MVASFVKGDRGAGKDPQCFVPLPLSDFVRALAGCYRNKWDQSTSLVISSSFMHVCLWRLVGTLDDTSVKELCWSFEGPVVARALTMSLSLAHMSGRWTLIES
jgi:hypothetical protein